MADTPSFAATPRQAVAEISTGNTARNGSGTVPTVFTAGSNGSRVERTRIVAQGTTTDGVVRLYLHDGSNSRLLKEVLVSAITPSTTVAVFESVVTWPGGLMLPNGWSLRAAPHNSETFNVFCEGGDF